MWTSYRKFKLKFIRLINLKVQQQNQTEDKLWPNCAASSIFTRLQFSSRPHIFLSDLCIGSLTLNYSYARYDTIIIIIYVCFVIINISFFVVVVCCRDRHYSVFIYYINFSSSSSFHSFHFAYLCLKDRKKRESDCIFLCKNSLGLL